jgi:hypothetical protein
LFRVVLPLTDLLFMYFGVVGFHNGIGSVQEAGGQAWQAWWSGGIALSAVVAFFGVAFPALWRIEVVGKIALISLVTYYVALFLARGVDDTNVTATAGLMVILILLPIWRLADLGYTAWKQKRGGA